MDINNMKIFIKIVDTGSMHKASSELFMSQPSLSKIVNKLETSLNTKLLQRTNKGVFLTKEGYIAYNFFKKFIELEKNLYNEIVYSKDNIQQLKILALPSVANYSLPCTLYSLKSNFNNIKFKLGLRNSSTKIVSEISEDTIDIGFVSRCESCDFLKIQYKKAYEDNIVLVSSTKNKENSLKLEHLYKYEFINYIGDDSFAATILEKIPNYNNLISQELESIESIKHSVIQSKQVAFLPYSSVKKELYRKELKIIEIENINIYQEIYIARRKNIQKDNKEIIDFIEKFILDTIC